VVVCRCGTLAALKVSFKPFNSRFVERDETRLLKLRVADEEAISSDIFEA
jgi:hypothetical protein